MVPIIIGFSSCPPWMAGSPSAGCHIHINPQVRSIFKSTQAAQWAASATVNSYWQRKNNLLEITSYILHNQCGSLSVYRTANIHLYKTWGGSQKTYLPLAAQWAAKANGWTQHLSKMHFPTHVCTCAFRLPQKELCDQRCQQLRKKSNVLSIKHQKSEVRKAIFQFRYLLFEIM